MPLNIPIPNGIFSPGANVYGPATLVSGDAWLFVFLDRSVNQGLNSRTATTTVRTVFEMLLPDAPGIPSDLTPGVWYEVGRTTFEGGNRIDSETGQAITADNFGISMWSPDVAGRQVRLTVTVAGGNVRLAGSLQVT